MKPAQRATHRKRGRHRYTLIRCGLIAAFDAFKLFNTVIMCVNTTIYRIKLLKTYFFSDIDGDITIAILYISIHVVLLAGKY
jgi:hypothetical protein